MIEFAGETKRKEVELVEVEDFDNKKRESVMNGVQTYKSGEMLMETSEIWKEVETVHERLRENRKEDGCL